jgi:very-short-patch-repair endonuclease
MKLKSDPYLWFEKLLIQEGLPRPTREYRFHPTRRWKSDFAWPDKKLICEVEGGVWSSGRHTRGKGFIGDIEKYNSAIELGYTVLRFTPQMLKTVALDQIKSIILG